MQTKIRFPQTLVEAIRYFSDPKNCHDFMVALRWPNGITCPTCGSKEVGKLVVIEKNRKGEKLASPRRIWNCKNRECPKPQFSAKRGTIFEDSPLGLDTWLTAVWMITNAKNGISSYELHRSLGVTQKTAWFVLHRIRLAMHDDKGEKFKGEVEADETFIGGKARNKHQAKRRYADGWVGKTAVFGLLERNAPEKPSRVKLKVVPSVRRHDLDPEIRKQVEAGSEMFTDALPSYKRISDEYVHNVIDKAECYAKGRIHTNGLENFWSLLKRGIKGTYVSVEPFHLFRYLDEQAFRFNERKDNDGGRFARVFATVANRRLTYKKLTGKAVA
jgi:hypothetical protein